MGHRAFVYSVAGGAKMRAKNAWLEVRRPSTAPGSATSSAPGLPASWSGRETTARRSTSSTRSTDRSAPKSCSRCGPDAPAFDSLIEGHDAADTYEREPYHREVMRVVVSCSTCRRARQSDGMTVHSPAQPELQSQRSTISSSGRATRRRTKAQHRSREFARDLLAGKRCRNDRVEEGDADQTRAAEFERTSSMAVEEVGHRRHCKTCAHAPHARRRLRGKPGAPVSSKPDRPRIRRAIVSDGWGGSTGTRAAVDGHTLADGSSRRFYIDNLKPRPLPSSMSLDPPGPTRTRLGRRFDDLREGAARRQRTLSQVRP